MTLEQLIRAAAADIDRLPEQIGVKSIQRGTGDIAADNGSITINIREVDPTRCLVLLDDSGGYKSVANNSSYTVGVYLSNLTTSQLTVAVRTTSTQAFRFSYQIIEFF